MINFQPSDPFNRHLKLGLGRLIMLILKHFSEMKKKLQEVWKFSIEIFLNIRANNFEIIYFSIFKQIGFWKPGQKKLSNKIIKY